MKNMLSPFTGFAYTLLRCISGALFAFHGLQKVFGVLSDQPSPPVGSQMWIGGVLEIVCGALIVIGWFTSLAAFIASGEMAVAYVQFHWKLQFDANFFPAINKGELALVYSFLFLYIACRGTGSAKASASTST
jgi:putative oxidoreductase